MITIITTKRLRQMKEDIKELREALAKVRGSLLAMQELLHGNYNKYQYEKRQLEDKVANIEVINRDLQAKLHKADHERNEALKKLRRYEK